MDTKVQNKKQFTNSPTEKDFRKAVQLANNLEFIDFEVDENVKINNWFGLFLDDSNAFWTIKMTNVGTYCLYREDEKICSVGKDLERELDAFREDQLGAEERSIQSHREYLAEQSELWANYGYGRI
ncbi:MULTISPECIES: hypothetical protein [Chryseobacterium]|uniref:Uncharacterized protein n=1 Tax=Chryseobacterium gambrini TaxID=373672 RepID=A0A1N7LGD3_9FLAO|nr:MULTISPECIES: hypothetical protein [Chryseobacterium]SIS72879.1 hypothetical protein SAMN05421785_102217 [Chryseobacterium gambrini]